jgi:Predicted acyl-CoA transferases/carnitine dehydratase
MSDRLSREPALHWIALLDAAGVPCGVVRSVLESLHDVECSPATGVGPSVPGTVRLAPPRLDQHGAEIRGRGWNAFSANP